MTEVQKAYLRKHNVSVVLDNAIREMLEEKPTKPIQFLVNRLKKEVGDLKEEPGAQKDGGNEELIDISTLNEDDRSKIIKIQAQYRGGKAREEFKKKKEEQKEAPAENGKAGEEGKEKEAKEGGENNVVDTSNWSKEDKDKIVLIQAQYRGGKARKEAAAKREERKEEKKEVEEKKEEKKEEAKEEEKKEEEKKEEEKEEEGKKEEKKEEGKKEEEKKEEEKEEGKNEENEKGGEPGTTKSEYSKEDEANLVKIQARYRGGKAREEAKKLKEDKAGDSATPAEGKEGGDGGTKEVPPEKPAEE